MLDFATIRASREEQGREGGRVSEWVTSLSAGREKKKKKKKKREREREEEDDGGCALEVSLYKI